RRDRDRACPPRAYACARERTMWRTFRRSRWTYPGLRHRHKIDGATTGQLAALLTKSVVAAAPVARLVVVPADLAFQRLVTPLERLAGSAVAVAVADMAQILHTFDRGR